ncbi:MAG: TomO hydrophobic C-terminal domain-containing protein [Wolbachia sp.]
MRIGITSIPDQVPTSVPPVTSESSATLNSPQPPATNESSGQGDGIQTNDSQQKEPISLLVNDIQGSSKQPGDPDKNNTAPQSTKSNKWPAVATWMFAMIGVLAVAAAPTAYFAFSVSLLTTGITAGVGACCLFAAVIIYCCNRPSNSLECNNVEPVANGKLFG